ncbi:hypothetical protein [Sphingopyxis bauzanensis]|uniref:hypothetical protein n=1 Tax=Sphingopyxis bauzanensis TaxID=651663 RepID=UPI0013901750|nr:hypothetical protein [Sphingopyxis bauzanensis]GGJ47517.1 hypothetical protein GCM10011393_17150 [Sphingopyxis bauzanensis]
MPATATLSSAEWAAGALLSGFNSMATDMEISPVLFSEPEFAASHDGKVKSNKIFAKLLDLATVASPIFGFHSKFWRFHEIPF